MDSLTQETLVLRDRYDDEPPHSDHVAQMALQIFDGLQSWHGFASRTRSLQLSGALLHDVGWSQTVEGKGHHKKSAQLIRDFEWKNLSAREEEMVALIARYHRRAIPQPEHIDFHALAPADQHVVMVLGGILRIADALDRTHTKRITRVEAKSTPEALTVSVHATGNWDEERAAFCLKRDMLEVAAKRAILVQAAV